MARETREHREADLSQEERFLRDRIREDVRRTPRLLPTDFTHVTRRVAEDDLAKAVALRREFARTGTERGFLLEQFLQQQIELSNWFGDNAFVFSTTDFDDLRNGVDAVIEFNPHDRRLLVPRLAVDVTTAASAKVLQEKAAKIYEGGRVKYFRSEIETNGDGNPTDLTLGRLPMVVIGIDAKLFGDIARSLYEKRTSMTVRDVQTNEVTKKLGIDRQFLANHPLKGLFLDQARAQLLFQRDNPQAAACLRHIEAELEKIKSSPEYQRAKLIGKASPTHRSLTLAA
ncbi:MAG: hypothetical protein WCO25_06150 [Candidatus Uhrbacteria bacterium]